jgi:predicted secreted protein
MRDAQSELVRSLCARIQEQAFKIEELAAAVDKAERERREAFDDGFNDGYQTRMREEHGI